MAAEVSDQVATTASLQLDSSFAETPYTIGHILSTLKQHNPKFCEVLAGAKVKNLSHKDISDGKGCMSQVLRTVIEFDNNGTYSFIAKVPRVDLEQFFKTSGMSEEDQQNMCRELKDIHTKECDSYTFLKSITDFPSPNVYYIEYASGEKPGFILMEDLSGKAATMSLFRSSTKEQCLNVARHFGGFQAQMNKISDKWKGKYLTTYHTNSAQINSLAKTFEKLVKLDNVFEEPIKRLLELDLYKFTQYVFNQLPEELNAKTLSHGDLGGNNIMMKLAKDGTIMNEIEAYIDWQIIHEGNPYHDLARFLTNATDGDVRRGCEVEATNLHYNTFCEKSKELGLQVGFKREEAHKLFDFAACQQAFELIQITVLLNDVNLEKSSEDVWEAQKRKCLLRMEFVMKDLLKRMEKHGVFEQFKKKQ